MLYLGLPPRYLMRPASGSELGQLPRLSSESQRDISGPVPLSVALRSPTICPRSGAHRWSPALPIPVCRDTSASVDEAVLGTKRGDSRLTGLFRDTPTW